jgi:hypothetical protein
VHLITGAIIAALLGNKSSDKESRSPILSIRGPINTTHLLPGRVRFHIPSLKNNDIQAAMLQEQLPKIKGITALQVTKQSGSVLVHFEEAKIRAELLAAALIRLLGLEKELEKTPQPSIPREIREMGNSLNRAVYEKTGGLMDLWTAIPLLLIVVAGRKIITDKTLTAPAAATLLWWGYNSFFHENRRCD